MTESKKKLKKPPDSFKDLITTPETTTENRILTWGEAWKKYSEELEYKLEDSNDMLSFYKAEEDHAKDLENENHKLKKELGDLGEKILDMLVEEINKQEDVKKQELIADIYQKAGHIVFNHIESERLLNSIDDNKDETTEREK